MSSSDPKSATPLGLIEPILAESRDHQFCILLTTGTADGAARAIRFVNLVPELLGSVLKTCDVFLGPRREFLAVLVRADADNFENTHRARLTFWAAVSDGQ